MSSASLRPIACDVAYGGSEEFEFRIRDATPFLATLPRRLLITMSNNGWEIYGDISLRCIRYFADSGHARAKRVLAIYEKDKGNDGEDPDENLYVSFRDDEANEWLRIARPNPDPDETARAKKAWATRRANLAVKQKKIEAKRLAVLEWKRKEEQKRIDELVKRFRGPLLVKRVPMLSLEGLP